MKIQPYVDKLSNSGEYQSFLKENPDAFMTAGFFVIDLESGKNVHQLDFYVPSKKKIAAFTLDDKIIVQMLDAMSKTKPQKLDTGVKIDLDALKGIVEDEMKNRNMSEEIKKMIAILQNIDGRKVWNINCVLSGLHILKSKVDDESKSILEMEKKSVMDFVKTIPKKELAKMQAQKQEPTKTEVEDEIKKLDKLEEVIEDKKNKLKNLKNKIK